MKDKIINAYQVDFQVNGADSSVIDLGTSKKEIADRFTAMNSDDEAVVFIRAEKFTLKGFTDAIKVNI